jgi:hypothetical protein
MIFAHSLSERSAMAVRSALYPVQLPPPKDEAAN